MGAARWRFARTKRIGGRATVVAVLELWPVTCSLVVAAGSMMMIGIMLFQNGPSERPRRELRRFLLYQFTKRPLTEAALLSGFLGKMPCDFASLQFRDQLSDTI
jgi:hypothetical protein